MLRSWKRAILSISAFCVAWGIAAFAPMPYGLLDSQGWVCPRRTICAGDWLSIVLLAVSRTSAYFCYPLMMLVFLSKANNLRTLFMHSPLVLVVPLYDLHEMHTFCGRVVELLVIVHSVCHMVRWGLQGEFHFLWSNVTGRSGAIALLVTPLIAWPMSWAIFKKTEIEVSTNGSDGRGGFEKKLMPNPFCLSWEVRKALHYLSIAWGICIVLHAPKTHIGYLVGIPVFMYIADYIYGFFWRTYQIAQPTFTRIECATQLVFKHPPGFQSDGTGYVMICIPWLNVGRGLRHQWHPFSLFAHPTLADHSCVCIAVHAPSKFGEGDWTKALHRAITASTHRPVFIAGPFAAP